MTTLLCDYGCGKEALYKFKNGKVCCSKIQTKCEEIRRRNSKTNKIKQSGENNGMFGKKHSIISKKKNSETHKGKAAWNKGISYGKGISLEQKYGKEISDQIKEKRSKALKGKSYIDLHGYEKAEELKRKCGSYIGGKTWDKYYGKEKSKQIKDKLSKSLSIAIIEGRLQERKPGGKYKYITGRFKSKKTNEEITYQSSFELAMFRKLENDERVEWFKKPNFYLPYYYKEIKHRYHPDILVRYKNIPYNFLYEIKPSHLLNDEVNIKKFETAISNEQNFNYKFKIITEVSLKKEIMEIYSEVKRMKEIQNV